MCGETSKNLEAFSLCDRWLVALTKKDWPGGGAGGEMINLIDSHFYFKSNLTNHRRAGCSSTNMFIYKSGSKTEAFCSRQFVSLLS